MTVPKRFMDKLLEGAHRRGIEVSITIEDIELLLVKQKGKCALSGLPLTFGKRAHRKDILGSASADRIDCKKDYTNGNVQLLDKKVNMAKHVLGNEDFIALCSQVTEYQNGKAKKRSKKQTT